MIITRRVIENYKTLSPPTGCHVSRVTVTRHDHRSCYTGPSNGYSLDVDHGQGVSYQRVSGFDDQGNQFGYQHDFTH